MNMRFDGILKSWNDQRGFGFITPKQGGQDIFVHILVFPRDGLQPRPGEALSFQIEVTSDGKKQAVGIRRPQDAAPGLRPKPKPARLGRYTRTIAMLVIVAVGVYGYQTYLHKVAPGNLGQGNLLVVGGEPPPLARTLNVRCDGRTHCSQMTSCSEAIFFLQNCPAVEMDGNHDGVPCEQQWCTSAFSR